MNESEITNLFNECVNLKGIAGIAGVTKSVIYNYRKRAVPSIGEQMNFLFKIGMINISKSNNEPTPATSRESKSNS